MEGPSVNVSCKNSNTSEESCSPYYVPHSILVSFSFDFESNNFDWMDSVHSIEVSIQIDLKPVVDNAENSMNL